MLLTHILPVFLGGAIGATSRFLVMHYWAIQNKSSFPMATVLVNCIGCLLIGILWTVIEKLQLPIWVKLLVITGGLGAFTTFSTYGVDLLFLMERSEFGRAALYFLLSNALGLFCVWGGLKLSRVIFQ
ncbi:fluoride efflux transporter CrcB [Candidatus Marinamargulisbacteria bacterium SCGC AAA071-K20]|nr:fluoride efflux transporter CrcB [Candidatus Marinamargulisbacteria bacterium SCGC AAA071-K20]